jgi:hypothetical protein
MEVESPGYGAGGTGISKHGVSPPPVPAVTTLSRQQGKLEAGRYVEQQPLEWSPRTQTMRHARSASILSLSNGAWDNM